MPRPKRGEVWAADLNPQGHRAEPGKTRPVLVIQTNPLNDSDHSTTIVVPGTANIQELAPDDSYPLRVRIQRIGRLTGDTEFMVDQIRAIATSRLQAKLAEAPNNVIKKVMTALGELTR